MTTKPQVRAGIYARKSSEDVNVESGQPSRSVAGQLTDCRQLAWRLGWTIVTEYPEDDTSAFKKRVVTLPDGRRVKRNVRPLWTKLLDDLYHGRIEALVAYDLDRSMREPRDLEDLIEIAEQQGRPVESVTGSLRLDNDANITMARVMVAVANKSSRDTSRRVTKSVRERAASGTWHGGSVPFGYRITGGKSVKLPNGRTRVSRGKLTVDPKKAKKIRDAAERALRGESLYSITEGWNREGFLTQFGKHWRTSTLAALLVRPALIGMREHEGTLHKAQWKPILDEDTRTRLQALFADPARRFMPSSVDARGGKFPLGGLTFCANDHRDGSCHKRLISQRFLGTQRLICHKQATDGCGKLSINYEPLQEFVLDMLFARLSSPEWLASLNRRDTSTTDPVRALSDELGEIDRQRLRVGDAVVMGAYTKAQGETKVRELDEKAERLRLKIGEITLAGQFAHVETAADARALWEALGERDDVVTQRAFLARFIDRVLVAPHPAGYPTHLTVRKGESNEDLVARRWDHQRDMLRRRVKISWRE